MSRGFRVSAYKSELRNFGGFLGDIFGLYRDYNGIMAKKWKLLFRV